MHGLVLFMTFLEFLKQEGIQTAGEGEDKHSRPGWVQMECIWCGKGSGKLHLGYNIERKSLACWKCKGHSAISYVMEYTGKPYGYAKDLLGSGGDDDYQRTEIKSRRGTLVLPKPIRPLGKVHLRYLERRLPKEEIERWDLQGLHEYAICRTPADKIINLNWRVFIPYKLGGETLSWTTRAIGKDVEPRYWSASDDCEKVNHKELLFGEDFCSHAVCAVEGPFDAMHCGPGFVALSGTAYTRAQVLRLSRFLVRGVWFDNEPKAQEQADKLCDALDQFPGDTYKISSDSEDPGTASAKEIARVRRALNL